MEPSPKSTTAKFVRLEPIREEHLPAVLAIEKVANSAPWSERSFRNELKHEHGIFLVAIANGAIVGYGGLWLVIDEAHVTNIAVTPEVRRQGVARKILTELLRKAKERGMTCSTLEVRASNEAAIKLYEDFGYIATARRKGYYPDNKEDAVVMWLYDLESWESGTK